MVFAEDERGVMWLEVEGLVFLKAEKVLYLELEELPFTGVEGG